MADFDDVVTELEDEEVKEFDKVEAVIDNASPEELAAMLEKSNKGESISSDDSQEGTKSTDKTNEEEPEVEESTSEKSELEKPVIEDKEVTLPNNGLINITDDYLAKADPKDKTILTALKGETLSPKALQNYINAQRHIGTLAQKAGQNKTNETQLNNENETVRKPIPDEIPQQQLTEEVANLKDQEVINRLRSNPKFRDLPHDQEDLRDYLATLSQTDPERLWDYREAKREVQKKVDSDFNRAIYVENNHVDINKQIISNEINAISDKLSKWGIEDPKQLGIDFTPVVGPDGQSRNELLASLVFENGQIDQTLVEYVGKRAIFKPGALLKKFLSEKADLIMEFKNKKTAVDSKRAAYDELSNAQNQAPNTASLPKGTGTASKVLPKIKSLDDIDDLPPNDIDALLKG